MTKQKYSEKSKIHTVYKLKDGTKVPGVTTILNELAKPALIPWAWDLGMKGIDYRVYRDELADVGKLVHNMILCDLKDEKCDTGEYSKRQIDQAENCFLSYLEWKRQRKIEPIIVEESLISEYFGFGGTPDFYGKIDDIFTLLDFKTGKRLYDEHLYQLAGYKSLLADKGHCPEQFILLNFGRAEDEKFEQLIRKGADCLKYEGIIFFSCLNIYKAKKENKK